MTTLLILIFVLGYLFIAFEHSFQINKAATALLTAALCWSVYALGSADKEQVVHHLSGHLGDISGILFFLLGAMVIVELIDAHDGFELITRKIQTTDKKKLVWLLAFITFFLSAVLDNLTTTIVMVSLLRKLIGDRKERLLYAGHAKSIPAQHGEYAGTSLPDQPSAERECKSAAGSTPE